MDVFSERTAVRAVARTMRTSEQIRLEIEQTFGFFPPFFEPALAVPEVLENLWQQTLSAYVENPLSALFKEKLNALLSRFCAAPYCMIVHSSALRPLGMTAPQVLALLDAPSLDDRTSLPLGALSVPTPDQAAAPAPDSPLENALLFCSTAVFLERNDAPICLAELRRLLGPELYPHLAAYLAYIKTCHIWIEAHPEVSYDADKRAQDNLGPLLAEEPALGDFFRHYQERIGSQRLGRETRRIADELLKAEQARTAILESITDAFITLDPAWHFTYINDQAERLLSRTREDLLGRSVWEEFPEIVGTKADREYHRAVEEGIAVSFEQLYSSLSTWFQVRAYPSAEGLSVFFQDITAHKMAEAERERILIEQRARAERETLLNQVGQALLDTTDPAVIQGRAATLLGEALGADRCYLSSWDAAGEHIVVLRDYHRTGLVSVTGEYSAPDYAPVMDALFANGTAVVPDVRSSGLPNNVVEMMTGFALNCVLAVPFFENEGRIAAALMVAMVDAPHEWTPEEVCLVETVAAMTRTAVESARVSQREHNIAEQLQRALQPPLPEAVPGLKVTRYYEAALTEEAGVGGDFFDVFAINKGCTALVVGDLSGKGLQAAAQVSVVRNMLRALIYSQNTLADAVTELNRALAENRLVEGFATLFVSAYDSGTRVLRYVNCGQEPALLRRAVTGRVEELSATGPILGGFAIGVFEERLVTLARGDALAIFSDGLTECGPNRLSMLGVEGVSALFGQSVPNEDALAGSEMAEHLALHLIAGVDAAAEGGVMRDDVCLLVAVVED